MTNIVLFKASKEVNSQKNLANFIDWAKITLPQLEGAKQGIPWDADSWTHWGIPESRVSGLESRRGKVDRMMAQPFRDFAKAVMIHRFVKNRLSLNTWVNSLKGLEAGLLEVTGTLDVTRTNAAVCTKACDLMQSHWPKGSTAYQAGNALTQIIALMREYGLLVTVFHWSSAITGPRRKTLKQQEHDSKKKLPSERSLIALGEIFYARPTLTLDIAVTSSVALLLCAPARISELAYVTHDIELEEIDPVSGQSQLYLRWYGAKGFGDKPVPVIDQMRATCEEAIQRVRDITKDGRAYASWLENHPDEFPPHPMLPDKRADDPLSYEEACDALMLSYATRGARSKIKHDFLKPLSKKAYLSPIAKELVDELMNGFEQGTGQPIWENRRIARRVFNDTCVLTLKKLNLLMREKYLPRYFPYTDEKRIIKYSDALFTMRTGMLNDNTADSFAEMKPLGVTLACDKMRLNGQLTGSQKQSKSIFERWNYPGLRVNSHSFRHYLNTSAQRAGLSQLLIAAWSGRIDTRQNAVYNHESVEERTNSVALARDNYSSPNNQLLYEKARSNQPIRLADITNTGHDQDRTLHIGAFGVCSHDFAESPCPKIGACVTCGNLFCIKGDDAKLKNLKTELERLDRLKCDSEYALHRGVFGAERWIKKANHDRLKCQALIALLENPELENGAIVWNLDDGWTLTTNALSVAGKMSKKPTDKSKDTPLSLGDLKALVGR